MSHYGEPSPSRCSPPEKLILRSHLTSCFRLPGEAQKIDRVLERFAHSYYAQNSIYGDYVNADSVWALAFATILLNVDAHNPKIKKKMSKPAFLHNCRQSNEGTVRRIFREILLNFLGFCAGIIRGNLRSNYNRRNQTSHRRLNRRQVCFPAKINF